MACSFDRGVTDAVPQLQGRKHAPKCLLCGVRSFASADMQCLRPRHPALTAAFAATAAARSIPRIFVVEHESKCFER